MHCTAQFVGGKNTLMTAAHCLIDCTGSTCDCRRHTYFTFVQQYSESGGTKKHVGVQMFYHQEYCTTTYIAERTRIDYAFINTLSDSSTDSGWLGLYSPFHYKSATAVGKTRGTVPEFSEKTPPPPKKIGP